MLSYSCKAAFFLYLFSKMSKKVVSLQKVTNV